MSKEKLVVVLTVLVDVIGFGIVIPILPFYVTSFGASPLTVTLLFSAFAFFAFLSSPFLGALSDRIGRRPVLLLSIASTAIGWVVFASASSIPFLFLGRIIDGAAAGNMTVAQSCIVDLSHDEKERSANLGLLGAVFGVGLMVGPTLGALLSTVSHAFPFWVAGMLATVNTLVAFFFLPETNRKRNPSAPFSINPLAPLERAARSVELRPIFIAWILFATSFMSSQSVFALYAQGVFAFTSVGAGLLFTAFGVVTVLNQAILLRYVWLRFFTETKLQLTMTIVLATSLLLMGLEVRALFYIGILFLGTSQSVLRVVMTSRVAGLAPPQMKGEVLGIMTSLMAACMVIAPVIAGSLFELHKNFPYFFGSLLMSAAVWFEVRSFRMSHSASIPQKSPVTGS